MMGGIGTLALGATSLAVLVYLIYVIVRPERF